jgi:hypothetical protein
MPVRLWINEGGEERAFEIKADKIILGRGQENEVCVSDSKCSRRHCQIERNDHGYKLIDLESRNGTRVNDALVNQKLLVHGDVIRIGDTSITFDDGSGRPMEKARKVETEIPKGELVKEPAVKEVVKEIKIEGAPKVGVPLTPHTDSRTVPLVEAPLASEGARRTTEANRIVTQRRVDHNRPTVNDSASARVQVQEVRRQQEERNLIKAIAIGVGVFFGLILLLIIVGRFTGKSPDRRMAEETYGKARAKYSEGEHEPDPKFALAFYREAVEQADKVSNEEPDLYARAQDLKKQAQEMVRVKEQQLHKDEFEALEKLAQRGNPKKNLTSAEIDQLFKDIAEFRKRFTQGDQKLHVDTEKRLIDLENTLKAQKGTSKQLDFSDLKTRVQDATRNNRFVDALKEADAMTKRFETDPVLLPKCTEIREEVMKATGEYVESKRKQAKELKKQGQVQDAKSVYNETIDRLGDGLVDAFKGYVELLKNERDH